MVTFFAPDGTRMQLSSIDLLKESILSGNEQYWTGGSGDASLEFQGDAKHVMIFIFSAEHEGFYLELLDTQEIYDPLVSVGEEVSDQPIKLWVGGVQHSFPANTVVSREMTLEALAYFVETGDAILTIPWQRRSAFDWPLDEEL